MSETDIERLKRLEGAATGGPWELWGKSTLLVNPDDGEHIGSLRKKADADLVLASINALPAFLELAEAAWALISAKSDYYDSIPIWSESELTALEGIEAAYGKIIRGVPDGK